MRAITLGAFLLITLNAAGSAAQSGGGLTDLFRTEIELAGAKLKLKGPALDAEVALALAATGASWRPTSGHAALFVQEGKTLKYADWRDRLRGFQSAQTTGDRRAAFCFAFSMVVDLPETERRLWDTSYAHVAQFGGDVDRLLVGILSASDRLPLLHRLSYSAADLLVLRTAVEHIPLYLNMAESKDTYMRSRGVAALGLLCYTPSPKEASPLRGLHVRLQEYPISAAQRSIFREVVNRASTDRSYRVRAAAALALGLSDFDGARARLQRLAEDRAYISSPGRDRSHRRIVFPVRETAGCGLQRLGISASDGGGEFAGADLRAATRRSRDVTRDMGGLRPDIRSAVRLHDWAW